MAEYQYKYDALTGLLTEKAFVAVAGEVMQDEYMRGHRPVVLTMDFIGMKGFNNKYGRVEGDILFVAFAHLLEKYFNKDYIAHFYEDHFYAFTDRDNVEDIINNLIIDLHTLNDGKTLPVKIGICEYNPAIDIPTICDWARIASESRRHVYASNYAWFDDTLYQEYEMREFVLTHIDQAIEAGDLQVYYQPVIRNLTGKLASCEALVRWIDPEKGMISPGDFVPILEESGVSYKVDTYVVNTVCSIIREDMLSGKTCVPCSVNISRADFDAIDPVEMVVNTVDAYEIPRSLLYIEITESALASNGGVISFAIERFHEAGFTVWMDDFGSGYSSLNILKDYDFDGLKIDMNFLRHFNDRSKDIIDMTVQMAKKLGIHTVAEGVETKEHLQFLREIGCEKIQGYYYGRPLPQAEAIANIASKDIGMETAEDAAFYDELGLAEMTNNLATALFFYDGYDFSLRFRNAKYIDENCFGNDKMSDDLEWSMNSAETGTGRKYRVLAERAMESGQTETMSIAFNDKYYNFSFKCLAKYYNGAMLEAILEKLNYEEKGKFEFIDLAAKQFVTFFDTIYISDMDDNTLQVLINNFVPEAMGTEITDVNLFYNAYVSKYIYYGDIERFAHFASKTSIIDNLRKSDNGYYSDLFRVRNPRGLYEWMEFFIIGLPETDRRRVLICTKPTSIDNQLDKFEHIKYMIGDSENISDGESIYMDAEKAIDNAVREHVLSADNMAEDDPEVATLMSIVSILAKMENVIDIEEAINVALKEIGELVSADRVYVIQTDRQTVTETYEWCREGVRAALPEKQNKKYAYMAPFEKMLEKGSCIRMDNVYSLRMKYLKAYNNLRAFNVERFILSPFYQDGALVGYLGIDNYSLECKYNVQSVLETMVKFVSAKIFKNYLYTKKDEEAAAENAQVFTSDKIIAEDMVRRVATVLESGAEYHDAVKGALDVIASEIHADKISIMEIHGDKLDVSFERCADGIEPEFESLQHLNYTSYVSEWERQLDDTHRCIVIEDTENYKSTNPVAYISLKRFGVNNLIAVPYYSNGRLRGYLRADNYRIKEYHKTREILLAVGYLIGAKINSHYYQKINSFDDLTGTHNRNAMHLKLDDIRRSGRPCGIIYADLNGLKEVNDKKGHEAGDHFIRNAATALSQVCGRENIYRTGGDEFIVLITDAREDIFAKLRQNLDKRLSSPLAPSMSVGYVYCHNVSEIDEAMKQADENMYESKRIYYTTHERYRG